MNFISWATKPTIINENTQNYIFSDLVEEKTLIGGALGPIAGLIKSQIGSTGFRDVRILFYQWLRKNYPDSIPSEFMEKFETRKPSAKDVNDLIRGIESELSPEAVNDIKTEFTEWCTTDNAHGATFEDKDGKKKLMSNAADFVNTLATLRDKKGVRPKAGIGRKIHDYSQVSTSDIANKNIESERERKAAEREQRKSSIRGSDISNEAISIKILVAQMLETARKDLQDNPVSAEADEMREGVLMNIADAFTKIRSIDRFSLFLDQLKEYDEYDGVRIELEDVLDAVETDVAERDAKSMVDTQIEDEEHEQEGNYPAREQEENLVGMEAVLDNKQSVIIVDHEPGTGFVFVQDEDSNEYKVPLSRLDFRVAPENGEHEQEEVSLEDAITLSHEEYEAVKNFQNFNPDEWQVKEDGSGWERKPQAEEAEEDSTNRYMSKAPIERREEAEEVKMSQLEINQYLAVQERQRVQNLYAQQRRHTYGY